LFEIRERQQVGSRLGRRVGAAGTQRKVLGGNQRLGQASVHLIGRHVHEPRDAVRPRRFEQSERAPEVGLECRIRREDRAVHVRLGGEVHNRDRTTLRRQQIHQRRVGDIAANKAVSWVAGHCREVLQVPRIRQLVQVHQARSSVAVEHHPNECRADEARTAGHQ
jgi:hypothetical protein